MTTNHTPSDRFTIDEFAVLALEAGWIVDPTDLRQALERRRQRRRLTQLWIASSMPPHG